MVPEVDPHLQHLLASPPPGDPLIDAVLTLDADSLRRCGADPADAEAVVRYVAGQAGARPAAARFFPRLGVLRLSAHAAEIARLLRGNFIRTAAAAEGFSITAAAPAPAPVPPAPAPRKKNNTPARRKGV